MEASYSLTYSGILSFNSAGELGPEGLKITWFKGTEKNLKIYPHKASTCATCFFQVLCYIILTTNKGNEFI